MDSLTQIILGASVGEAVLGKKVGNKALLWGAIAGTIPDLDVIAKLFTDPITANELHRGFSHSILFSILFAPLFGWLVAKLYKNKEADWKDWSKLMFWGLFTHPILDAFTTWGTQLFWPMDIKIALNNIFVADPLYTLPFLIFVIIAMCYKRTHPKRRFYNRLGLICSSGYIILTLLLQYGAKQKFIAALEKQHISYTDIKTRPTPLNSILWTSNIRTKDGFLIGYYSFLDKKSTINFIKFPKNDQLLKTYRNDPIVKRLIKLSEGWYTIQEKDHSNTFIFNDLRFGTLGMGKNSDRFVFSYELTPTSEGKLIAQQTEPEVKNASTMLSELWRRIKGN